VTVLYWIIDRNGTTLIAGQVVREYWTLVLVGVNFFSLCTALFVSSPNAPEKRYIIKKFFFKQKQLQY